MGTKSCVDEMYHHLNGKQDKHTVNLKQFIDLNVEYTYQQFKDLLMPLNKDFQRIQETKCKAYQESLYSQETSSWEEQHVEQFDLEMVKDDLRKIVMLEKKSEINEHIYLKNLNRAPN